MLHARPRCRGVDKPFGGGVSVWYNRQFLSVESGKPYKPFGGGVSVWYNRQFLSVESGKPYKPFGGGQPMDPFGGWWV